MRVLAIGGGIVAVALVATATFMVVRSPDRDPQTSSVQAEDATAKVRRELPRDPEAEAQVDELVAEGGIVGERRMIELYRRWAGQDDKVWARRKIIDALLAHADKKRGMKLLLEAVAGDETPVKDDEVLAYAAEQLQAYWTDPAMYGYGRDMLLVQRDEKPRALLAESLVDYTAKLDESADPEYQLRTGLASDMVDVFYAAKDEGSREHMLAGLDQLGGSDMAKLMRSPDLADVGELSTARLRVDATQQALADMDEALADEDDADWSGMLGPLRELAGLDRDELEERLAQQQ